MRPDWRVIASHRPLAAPRVLPGAKSPAGAASPRAEVVRRLEDPGILMGTWRIPGARPGPLIEVVGRNMLAALLSAFLRSERRAGGECFGAL